MSIGLAICLFIFFLYFFVAADFGDELGFEEDVVGAGRLVLALAGAGIVLASTLLGGILVYMETGQGRTAGLILLAPLGLCILIPLLMAVKEHYDGWIPRPFEGLKVPSADGMIKVLLGLMGGVILTAIVGLLNI